MVAASELNINTSATADQMAEEIFGPDVVIISANYYGDNQSSGIYSDAYATSPGVAPSDSGVILSTGHADDFTNSSGNANQSTQTSTNTSGLDGALGQNTYDGAALAVEFESDTPMMTMKFVFASEEYPEYQDSVYQDFVQVWVNGQPVDMTIGNGDADPGNINSGTNENLFVDNTNGDYNTEMDGFTVTLTLTFPVNTTGTNTLVIGIADVADANYDSNLLIAAESIQGDLVAVDDSLDMYPSGQKTIDVLANDQSSSGASLVITHINDVAVVAGDQVTLNTGQTVELNPDGTITVIGNGDTEDYNFNYTMSDGVESDTGFVSVNAFPCFAAGTMIAVPGGEKPVETLVAGDLVLTRDDGPQPIRWAGQRQVAAEGAMAPVRIDAGTFGAHRPLTLSPQHRVLVQGSLAELLFGETEVLVAAKHLVNDRTVRRMPGGEVTYVHLLFDRHQILLSEGLETESFLPGPQATDTLEQEVTQEILSIFPELDPVSGAGYGPAARRTLKSYEARLLAGAPPSEAA
ncbi:MAG: 2,3,4,5-tetrahydropyridine-2,6-carboxylate N-succinyltransferase [Rhodobacteraceae bacterium]|nr:2,3,4,5-tetrahydropyridine-2,6-carboxylate N-succinyltransferase [Paracoccaceae bacterium]